MPYPPKLVSEMLDIPPSSLRRLSSEFKDFLSKSPGRHRRYSEEDINTLRRVRELTGQGMTIERIKTQLRLVEEPPEKKTDALALVPTIAGELARMDDNYRAVARELEELRQDRERDRERLERLEQWAALPWYKRLFTRPPV